MRIPSVDQLLKGATIAPLCACWGRPLVKRGVQLALAALRTQARTDFDLQALYHSLETWLIREVGRPQTPVLNLTGVIIHSNLGRSLLPECAIAAMSEAARAATNLEFDLLHGRRGQREAHVAALLCELTGAEAATVVNNNAAALMLMLNSLALGQWVPVARGELIEIGGSFRLPELMQRSGCRLLEIGTTNRTHLRDYQQAQNEGVALLLKVHPSNYHITGFTNEVTTAQLAGIKHALPLIVDLGSGALMDLQRYGLPHEPTPGETLRAGADLVSFSGDKLLGGPQCGIIVGRKDLVKRIDENPLKRALRLDKVTLAGLAEVLKLYGDPTRLERELPLARLFARKPEEIRKTALICADALQKQGATEGGWNIAVAPCESALGSGSLPQSHLASFALRIESQRSAPSEHLEQLAAQLRRGTPPVIGRLHNQALVLDLRTLEHPETLVRELAAAFQQLNT